MPNETQRREWLPAFGDWDRLHVLLAVPYDKAVLGPFFQSFVKTLTIPFLKITPFVAPGAIIHLSRDAMIRAALSEKSVTHLCMVDSDQTFDPLVLPRLVGWDVPVVAPVIVQRNGDPIPVAYREIARDARGMWRHEPMAAEILAYLSQFEDTWWANGAATGVCPLQPQHAPQLPGIPDDVRSGLGTPLLPVDAVGTGMVLWRRDVLEAMQPDPQSGLYCSNLRMGGEDFELCRAVRAAGWGGLSAPGPKGHGVYVDRGCLVGHLTYYARGVGDLLAHGEEQSREALEREQAEAALPPAVPDLVDALKRPPWADVELPQMAGALA